MRFSYPENVCFACSRCGLCCGDTQRKRRRVLLLGSDVERIAGFAGRQIGSFAKGVKGKLPYVFEMRKNLDGKCVFFSEGGCAVYGVRPLICRFYPFKLSRGDEGFYIFKVTDECPNVSFLGKGEVKKRLDGSFFRELFELAIKELGAASG